MEIPTKGTNWVYRAKFQNLDVVVKKASSFADAAQVYYFLQDKFFYGGNRILCSSERAIAREAQILEKLQGVNSPALFSYREGRLIRQYVEADGILDSDDEAHKKSNLGKSLEAVAIIHDKGVVIGDSHVKNSVIDNQGVVYWLDFDGEFDEFDLVRAKALDLLRFVYSVYNFTREPSLTTYTAEQVRHYSEPDVMNLIRNLVTPGPSSLKLWFPTRVPLDEVLNRNVKEILRF